MNTTALRLIAAAVALTVAGTAQADIIGSGPNLSYDSVTAFPGLTVGSYDFSIDATGFENLSLSFDFSSVNTEQCSAGGDCLNVTAIAGPIPVPNTSPTHAGLNIAGPGTNAGGAGSFSGLFVDGDDALINFRFFFDWNRVNESLAITNIVLEGDAIAPPPPPPPPPSTGVSEPGTLAVLGLGLAGLGAARRRRKS